MPLNLNQFGGLASAGHMACARFSGTGWNFQKFESERTYDMMSTTTQNTQMHAEVKY